MYAIAAADDLEGQVGGGRRREKGTFGQVPSTWRFVRSNSIPRFVSTPKQSSSIFPRGLSALSHCPSHTDFPNPQRRQLL